MIKRFKRLIKLSLIFGVVLALVLAGLLVFSIVAITAFVAISFVFGIVINRIRHKGGGDEIEVNERRDALIYKLKTTKMDSDEDKKNRDKILKNAHRLSEDELDKLEDIIGA